MWIKCGENTVVNADNITTISIYENEEDNTYGLYINFSNGKSQVFTFKEWEVRKAFEDIIDRLGYVYEL